MADTEITPLQHGWMTEGIVIAAVPVAAYLAAFVYEAGYFTVFSIPLALVRVDLTTVFIALGALVAVLVFVFALANTIYVLLPGSKGVIHRSVVRIIFVLSPVVPFLVISGMRREQVFVVFALGSLVVMSLLVEFVFPLITQRQQTTYTKKLEAQEELDRRIRLPRSLIGNRISRPAIWATYAILVALVLSFNVGQGTALRQEEFLVTLSPSDRVVLRIYGDTLILAPFDRATQEIQREFAIQPIDKASELGLRLERVGPLRLEKKP